MGKVKVITLDSREAWLENRKAGIGGSDISAVIGLNPYMSNVELWERKTGRTVAPDISSKPFVAYGHAAEPHIRGLFAADHPEYEVSYIDNNSWTNTDYPWARASLDGWLKDGKARRGVLEIKTTEILRSSDWDKWTDRIPETYFCQVLFYMAVIEAEFVDLRAAIKYRVGDEKRTTLRDYHIERSEVENDLQLLMRKGAEFYQHIENDTRPALILPEI